MAGKLHPVNSVPNSDDVQGIHSLHELPKGRIYEVGYSTGTTTMMRLAKTDQTIFGDNFDDNGISFDRAANSQRHRRIS